jgi:hypothetical protein
MAFQEIVDHTKKVIDIAIDKPQSATHDRWHKLKEIALEIAIIVFAVSLSIWLHSVGEHKHEQKQVRSFLLGLKRDLRADINQLYVIMNEDQQRQQQLQYLLDLPPRNKVNDADFTKAFTSITKKHAFTPLMSRYEGFKSSGKLTNIENNVLLERITNLYQSHLSILRSTEQNWTHQQTSLQTYLDNDFSGENDFDHHYQLINARKGKRLAARLLERENLLEAYRDYIGFGTAIIKDIDATYPGNEESSFFSQKK